MGYCSGIRSVEKPMVRLFRIESLKQKIVKGLLNFSVSFPNGFLNRILIKTNFFI